MQQIWWKIGDECSILKCSAGKEQQRGSNLGTDPKINNTNFFITVYFAAISLVIVSAWYL